MPRKEKVPNKHQMKRGERLYVRRGRSKARWRHFNKNFKELREKLSSVDWMWIWRERTKGVHLGRHCGCCFSAAKSHPALCDLMECRTPGSCVLHYHPEFAQIHIHWERWCYLTISSSVVSFFCLQSFPVSGSFPMSQFFASDGLSIAASASASVLSMNI